MEPAALAARQHLRRDLERVQARIADPWSAEPDVDPR